ncbi:MAG: O-antigen ligase family protein [Flavobacteriales bacterium]|nr:O-antigen ligase family protein [Flavobacteriales bacterium]
MLVWLTYKLLDTPQKIKVVMGAFVIAALVSAIYSIPRGFVGETISESVRIAGLAGGANTAARYFIVAIAFISYLRSENKYFLMRLLLLIAIGILLYGTILTLSRTGLLLLAGLISMSFVFQRANKNRLQVIIIIVVAIAVIWTYAENLLGILSTILPSVVEGSDTVGLRYGLWQAGLRMWADHPILGVGMGRYVENLATYGWDLIPPHRLQLTAHNMYIAVLAETGLVGLGIFLAALIQNIADLRHSGANEEKTLSSLSHTWLIVFLLLLLGGVTKTDQIDKLLWISIGIPLAIRQIGTKTA